MKKLILLLTTCFLINSVIPVFAQVSINTDGADPDASAMLDVKSTTCGMLVPRMTQAERNAINGGTFATSLLIYQTDNSPGYYYYDGITWQRIVGGDDGDWTISGNNMYSTVPGNVGINTNSPGTALDVNGQVTIQGGNPDKFQVLTSTDNIGTAMWEPMRSLKFPDGCFPMTPVTHNFSGGSYIVPGGYNLYITNYYCSSNYNMMINSMIICYGASNYGSWMYFNSPIVAGQGDILSSNGGPNVTFNGFLVNQSVSPYTSTANITVSAGQVFVITSVCGTSQPQLKVDNKIVYWGYGNYAASNTNNFDGLRSPVLVGPGSTLSFTGGTINGYYINQ